MENYQVDNADIIYEMLENEIIIANLGSGNYYTIHHIGVAVWQLLLSNYTQQQIIQQLQQHYPDNTADFAGDLTQFLAQLQKEAIVSSRPVSQQIPINTNELFWPATYTPAHLEIYTDMQNLLILDPIHEVDAAGWPRHKIEVEI